MLANVLLIEMHSPRGINVGKRVGTWTVSVSPAIVVVWFRLLSDNIQPNECTYLVQDVVYQSRL